MGFDENRGEPLVGPDTPNNTKFHPEDAPPERWAIFERLRSYNQGTRTGQGTDQKLKRNQEKLARYDAISNQLELTAQQKREGRMVMEYLNLGTFGYTTELVAFCICALVARRDGRMYHPNRNDENNDSGFLNVAESVLKPRDQKLVIKCMHKLRDGKRELWQTPRD